MGANDICTIEELREVYGPLPNNLAAKCVFPSLDRHHRSFIALSPFLVIASADAHGMPDVSPRGDLPGFVAVTDDYTLLIPDRPGNKKLLTLSNIVENPNISLIFFIPGREDSLRVTGKAEISSDPALLAPLAVEGKIPQSALVVRVEQAWFHCGKALVRSRLWDQDSQVAPDALPSLGRMLADQIAGIDAAEAEKRLEESTRERLW